MGHTYGWAWISFLFVYRVPPPRDHMTKAKKVHWDSRLVGFSCVCGSFRLPLMEATEELPDMNGGHNEGKDYGGISKYANSPAPNGCL